MARQAATVGRTTLRQVCAALEHLAPLGRAEPWDNVGLLAGDPTVPVERVLLCIDLTADVVGEAVRRRVRLVVSYHPPWLKPITRLNAHSRGTDAQVFRCIARGIAIYSPHTALDCADGGTNDVLAALCGVKHPSPITYLDEPGQDECKVVVFVPPGEVDRVAEAMFDAGAGHIGEYSQCSYRISGQGTFLGSDATCPTLGQSGRFERVDEVRLESVAPRSAVPAVVQAIRRSHSYEESAFDVYPLVPRPRKGMGRSGRLPSSVPLRVLARRLARATAARTAQMVGDPDTVVSRAICMAGAAGSQVFQAAPVTGDVVVTGELRHHDALAVLRRGACAIALGHWSSERPVLELLGQRLSAMLPALKVSLSRADREPFLAA